MAPRPLARAASTLRRSTRTRAPKGLAFTSRSVPLVGSPSTRVTGSCPSPPRPGRTGRRRRRDPRPGPGSSSGHVLHQRLEQEPVALEERSDVARQAQRAGAAGARRRHAVGDDRRAGHDATAARRAVRAQAGQPVGERRQRARDRRRRGPRRARRARGPARSRPAPPTMMAPASAGVSSAARQRAMRPRRPRAAPWRRRRRARASPRGRTRGGRPRREIAPACGSRPPATA